MIAFRRLPLYLTVLWAFLPAMATPTPPPVPQMMYVALGDSLTAGSQSAGLTAQDQRDAYPAVIAQIGHFPFGVPASAGPGCPPPLGGPKLTAESCVRAQPSVRGSNFAVPGAHVEDLLNRTAKNAGDDLTRRLYTLILGPRQTQVQAAIKSRPRFISIWIGGNNVLDAAASGDVGGVTPPAAFEAAYRKVLDALAVTKARIVVFTVPDVTSVPLFISGPLYFHYGFGTASCEHSVNRIAASVLLHQQRVDCDAPYALTPGKILSFQQVVASYNASIRKLAQERGIPVFDVGPLLAGLQRPPVNPVSPEPFGPDFSRDGVHVSSAVQARLARALLVEGNARMDLKAPLP